MNTTIVVSLLLAILLVSDTNAQTRFWIRQFGTESTDSCLGVSADGLGNVYASGYTYGNLGGANAGNADAFVSKYDENGFLNWHRQIGTFANDVSSVISRARLTLV